MKSAKNGLKPAQSHAGTKSRSAKALMAGGLALAGAMACSRVATAAHYYYVAWTSADVSQGTATGTITLPDSSTVTVTFAALNADQTAGKLYGAQVNGQGANYWTPAATWTSTEVESAPPNSDILRLSGGDNETYQVTLSAPIVDPIMAIVSLGSPSVACTYKFDSPFVIESQGTDQWGGAATALTLLPNNVLQGKEGSGTIQFQGTFSTFSWKVPVPEAWHGFTFGIRTTLALDPDAGSLDASVGDAALEAEPDDAGPPLDDAGIDSGPVADDAGGAADAQAADAGAPADAAVGPDASVVTTSGDSGCSCRVGPSREDTAGTAFVALGAIALLRLARRKRG